jgi:ubiquinone/menaquinone biosynthesis C-methylase UbiE
VSQYALEVSDAEIRRYLMMAERAQRAESDLWERAGIVSGAVVADVGCGPGAVAIKMAQVVGPSGQVFGVERDPSALAAARRLVADAGIENVKLLAGSATETGLEPQSLDVAVLRHVLAHNGADEQRIVDHLAALVRSTGSVYLVDVDGTAIRMLDVDPEIDDLTQKYLEFHARRRNDLLVGLRLEQLLVQAGLEPMGFEGRYSIISAPPGVRPPSWAARHAMVAEQIASQEDLERWEQAFRRMDTADRRPTIFAPNFFAIGQKQ